MPLLVIFSCISSSLVPLSLSFGIRWRWENLSISIRTFQNSHLSPVWESMITIFVFPDLTKPIPPVRLFMIKKSNFSLLKFLRLRLVINCLKLKHLLELYLKSKMPTSRNMHFPLSQNRPINHEWVQSWVSYIRLSNPQPELFLAFFCGVSNFKIPTIS